MLRVSPATAGTLEGAAVQVLPRAAAQRLPQPCAQVLRHSMTTLVAMDDEATARAVAAVQERCSTLQPEVAAEVQLIMADAVAYLAGLDDNGAPDAVRLQQRAQQLLQ